jgi:hypothetical protein
MSPTHVSQVASSLRISWVYIDTNIYTHLLQLRRCVHLDVTDACIKTNLLSSNKLLSFNVSTYHLTSHVIKTIEAAGL